MPEWMGDAGDRGAGAQACELITVGWGEEGKDNGSVKMRKSRGNKARSLQQWKRSRQRAEQKAV